MKTALDPRHQHRRKVVQDLFAWEAQRQLKIENIKAGGEGAIDEKFEAIVKYVERVDSLISECAPEWDLEKINKIDLAVLRLAVFELVFERIEPVKVVIDEAVELAKEFGGETSPSFVNGVLGQVVTHPIRIKRIIADKVGVEEEKLKNEDNLLADLNLSEIEIADLITTIEKELSLPETLASDVKTVGDILNFVEEQNS